MSFNLEQDTCLEQRCCQLTFQKPLLDRPSANNFCPTLRSHLPYLLDTLLMSRVAHLNTMLYRGMGTADPCSQVIQQTHNPTQNLRPATQLSSLTLLSQQALVTVSSVLYLRSVFHPDPGSAPTPNVSVSNLRSSCHPEPGCGPTTQCHSYNSGNYYSGQNPLPPDTTHTMCFPTSGAPLPPLSLPRFRDASTHSKPIQPSPTTPHPCNRLVF